MPHWISVPPTQALAALAPVQVRATSADQLDFAVGIVLNTDASIRGPPKCSTPSTAAKASPREQ
ncbi:hypothetical protein PR003_g8239 [Phytophthora rubi]|uniref:Uncharacterized protein n=1 Tax=Phytophthora rubi TaxID=129364 RepID=A0A6A3NDV2_9STRA|nr:hypothetical protein PR002_g7756 [Phytophthora rubi]KAE9039153.1 hypothetical protein PR001_g7639 [Phytophthora rubi]KAE9344879.1 hypothetical protein PR003_g8239 [Phytophthora rubi]